jgi:hypothetical protein
MASDSPADAGPQTAIVAKTQITLRNLLPFIPAMALSVVFDFLILGILGAICRAALFIGCLSFVLFAVRTWPRRRALFDGEGMTLLARGIGRLGARPFHFRWDEVVEVRETSLWKGWAIRLRLNRPRKFWTFRSRPKNSILVPKGIWTDPRFAEALRAHVPAERIHADLASVERPLLAARYAWVLVLAMLLCAAVAAGCSFTAFHFESLIGVSLRLILELAIINVAILLCVDHAPLAFKVVAGFLITFAFRAATTSMLELVFPLGLRVTAGYWGAAAGALVGAAMMAIKGRKSHSWRFAGAPFLLAAAGFWCGWAGFHQIPGVRVGVGSLGYFNPWTPKGDAFLMIECEYSLKSDQAPCTLCWYSSELKLERRVVLPADAGLRVIGQEAALIVAGGKPDARLWFVPRHAEPRVIDKAPYFGRGCKTSPDFRRTLIPTGDAQGETSAWKICDLAAGKIEPVNFPVPLKEISVLALRDDETVLWLTGSGPLDKDNRPWAWANPVPENGEFPHPGKPYVIWSWKINSAEAPTQLYAARTQWFNWGRKDKPERLHVCRVAENPPARVEYVALDFTRSPPAVATISEEEFGTTWRPPQDRSFDGRFTVAAGKSDLFSPAFIVDTKTGRKFRMPTLASLLGMASLRWSPSANKFLLEVPEVNLEGELWRWRRDFEKTFESSTTGVYLVDMDRQ